MIVEKVCENVAIIGCGYVGKAVACYWQKQGHFVTVTTTRKERVTELEEVAAQVVIMTGNDANAVQSVVQNQNTCLLSLAPISTRQVDAEVYRETYIPTAKNVVAALKETSSVKQLIYLSSCSLYGNKNGEWVDENSRIDIDNKYNQVLGEAEQILLSSVREDLSVCILRLGGIYGSGRELMKRLSRLAGKSLPGSGENVGFWIHLDDIVGAVDFAHQHRLNGIYNLVNDLRWTYRDLCDYVCDKQGLERIVWDASQPSFRPLNAQLSNQKIKAAGYTLIHPQTIV
ncbi:MAG: NAD-dependent epimerase/dehydratase family protein [Coleofasciculus sp. B1-GNL1-01]|uniref:NAD-dependent epimerase/dehydratase family protein n=1 Tax=Coleofasciculus sp. B1-GNL1-01 TaxID=3068484 RepID=UPI0032F98E2A